MRDRRLLTGIDPGTCHRRCSHATHPSSPYAPFTVNATRTGPDRHDPDIFCSRGSAGRKSSCRSLSKKDARCLFRTKGRPSGSDPFLQGGEASMIAASPLVPAGLALGPSPAAPVAPFPAANGSFFLPPLREPSSGPTRSIRPPRRTPAGTPRTTASSARDGVGRRRAPRLLHPEPDVLVRLFAELEVQADREFQRVGIVVSKMRRLVDPQVPEIHIQHHRRG